MFKNCIVNSLLHCSKPVGFMNGAIMNYFLGYDIANTGTIWTRIGRCLSYPVCFLLPFFYEHHCCQRTWHAGHGLVLVLAAVRLGFPKLVSHNAAELSID
jgi:hypothetical protein